MDAFVDTLVQLLIDWGYVGLFISALLAGSIIPFSSEIVMVALGQGRSKPGTVRTLRHLGKYAGRHDVLLHGTSGTYRLD